MVPFLYDDDTTGSSNEPKLSSHDDDDVERSEAGKTFSNSIKLPK